MSRLRFLTAGESHGHSLLVTLEGIPADLPILANDFEPMMKARQSGYGRGPRMKIETDEVEILAGVRHGKTLGSPLALCIRNRDFSNWQQTMSANPVDTSSPQEESPRPPIHRPRPGHADLVGGQKYNQRDLRNILERASARETAARVAAGVVAKKLLHHAGVHTIGYVRQTGSIRAPSPGVQTPADVAALEGKLLGSELRCPDRECEASMKDQIREAAHAGDTLGGVFEVAVVGLPPGLGSHVQWDRKLDGRLAQAVMSIQAVKGVEIGNGFENAGLRGSSVHDAITYDSLAFGRATNRAGGLEGGITTGQPLIVGGALKPISTLKKPLQSVDITTKESFEAVYERSDVCAIAAASVIGEAMVALVLADAILEKFGGDSLGEMLRNLRGYQEQLAHY
jgi:chorismate synthase